MIVLGLSSLAPSGVVHDATASLVIDGKVIAAASEERFTGIKHYEGYPAMAIKHCLQSAGLRLSDVDKVAVGYGLLPNIMDVSSKMNFCSSCVNDTTFSKSPIENKKPIFFDHEYTHAKTGYFLSNFKKALVISLDGGGVDNGEVISGGIYVIDDGKIEVLRKYPISGSLGWTYGGFTEICGFRMLDGEGKTMSYAAFGESEPKEKKAEIFSKVCNIFPKYVGIDYLHGGIDPPKWKIIHNTSFARFTDPRLIDLLSLYNKELISWAAQKVLENIITEIASSAVEITGIKNVILTGGLFYNMIANMIVRENLEKMHCSVFINPICGDLGNAVGAALEAYYMEMGQVKDTTWMNLSLGPEYDDKQIFASIQTLNLQYSKVEKISTTIDLLDKGKVVGWFQGKTELGPRGLGNRSILSRADKIEFKDIINNKVKRREPWRPFCPTITVEKSNYYLENNTYAPYMILGFRMKHAEEVPSVTHIDNTTRPQTLTKEYNEDFYNVVAGLGGILLNTSMNLAGDPINTTPEDALISFKNSKMDALMIGDYLVER